MKFKFRDIRRAQPFWAFFKFELGNRGWLSLVPWFLVLVMLVMVGGFGVSYFSMTFEERLMHLLFWSVFGTLGIAAFNTLFSFLLRKWGGPLFLSHGLTAPIVAFLGAIVDTRYGYASAVFPENTFLYCFAFSWTLIFIVGGLSYFPRRKATETAMDEIARKSRERYKAHHKQFQNLLSPENRGEVLEISAEDKYCMVKTKNGSELVRISLSDACDLLDNEPIGIKIHRSYWLNFKQMDRLQYVNGNPRIILKNGEKLPVSREQTKKVSDCLKIISSHQNFDRV